MKKCLVVLIVAAITLGRAGLSFADHMVLDNFIIERSRVSMALSEEQNQIRADVLLDLSGSQEKLWHYLCGPWDAEAANDALAKIAKRIEKAKKTDPVAIFKDAGLTCKRVN